MWVEGQEGLPVLCSWQKGNEKREGYVDGGRRGGRKKDGEEKVGEVD